MTRKLIFVLENDPVRIGAMRESLESSMLSAAATMIDNVPDAVLWLSRHLPHCGVISLDHDLGGEQIRDGGPFDPGSGRDIANYLAERTPVCPVLLHTDNFFVRPRMVSILESGSWEHSFVSPGNGVAWVVRDWLPQIIRLLGD